MKYPFKNFLDLQFPLSAVDLFAGCGGLSLGFQNAGIEILTAFDNWPAAIEVYQQNFSHPIYSQDISQIERIIQILRNLSCDIIVGGPPCQDFSSAGKRDENLGRGDLTIRFAEIIQAIKPKFFVMENVERLSKSHKYEITRYIFKQAGYGLTQKVLDASLCGVPQRRKRFFWIGELGGDDDALLKYLETNLATQPLTLRGYFRESLSLEYYYRHPRSYQRRAIFSIDEPSPTIRGVNRPIPKTYQSHPGDAAPISAQIRPLTTLERSYIQTFPQNFKWVGSKTELEQMIGNAVPVKLAEYVARCLIQYVKEQKIQDQCLSRESAKDSVLA